MDPPTILAIKQAFLASAVRRLDQPLTPSRAWRRRSSSAAADGPNRLPPKAVDAVLDRVNHRLHQHARRVYAPPAVRHVAEQIDQLYSDEDHVLGDPRDGAAAAADDRRRPAASSLLLTAAAPLPPPDYTDPAVLDALPAAWADHDPAAAAALPLEARRYADQVERLRTLAAARAAAARRVQQLRRLAALAAPFGDADDDDDASRHRSSRSLQDGLVTRDGAVEAELERMRVLLARVGDRVASLTATPATTTTTAAADDTSKTVEDASRQRVQALLDLP